MDLSVQQDKGDQPTEEQHFAHGRVEEVHK